MSQPAPTPPPPPTPSPSPYRNEIDALRERKESLEREIARLKEHTSQLEGLRSREQELERELAGVAHQLSTSQSRQTSRRTLPMLDNVKVASPCKADWNEMLGDDRVRFCVSCEKNVYNLSAMPRVDAERLLAERIGNELCVRFYQRTDGTIMTQDCPVGVKKKQRKKLALAVAGAGAMALAATSMLSRTTCRPTQGAVAMPMSPPPDEVPMMGEPAFVSPPPTATATIELPPHEDGNWVAGGRMTPPPPPPPPPKPKKVLPKASPATSGATDFIMGRR